MRYLWLTRAKPYPPHKAGDVNYTRGLVEHLAAHAAVQVLALRTMNVPVPEGQDVQWTEVDHAAPSRQASVASLLPNVAHQNVSRDFLARAISCSAQADAIVVDNLAMAWCMQPLMRSLGKRRPPIVMVNHNFETAMRPGLRSAASSAVMRAVLTWDGWKAARLERLANRLADGVTAITPTDLTSFRSLANGKPAQLLMPGYDGPRLSQRTISTATPRRVAIIGGRGTFYKRMILGNLLRTLQSAGIERQLTVDVVGGGLEEGHASLQASFPGFNFLGFVDDLPRYMQTARLGIIADDVGGGFKIRALHHVFLRLPMLALDRALAGMELRSGTDFLSVPNLGDLPAVLLSVVDDVDRLDAVQQAAYVRYEPMFDWHERMKEFHAFVQGLRQGA